MVNDKEDLLMIKNKNILMLIVCVAALIFTACTADNEDDGVKKFYNSMNDPATEAVSGTKESKSTSGGLDSLYIVASIDSVQETIMVYSYESGTEYQYYYGLGTEFLNKYGDHISVGNVRQGDAVYISGTDSSGKIEEVRKSDAVWTNDTVNNFKVDKSDGILEIGSSKYRIDEQTIIFSGDDVIEADGITAQDTLSVVGVDKKIISMAVTTGHGTLELNNTSLFEGSFLQLGDRIFAEITPDMTLEVPEGKYTLAVANNGWGGTADIEIKRGETTRVNLDDLKGEGPKISRILFEVDVEGAGIYVDGEQIDYTAPVEITYGKHKLTVTADGFDAWTRTLYVNSAEATIQITINDSSDENTNEEDNSSNATAQTPSETASERATEKTTEEAASGKTDSEKTDNNLTNSELADYLSTLTSLMGLGGS